MHIIKTLSIFFLFLTMADNRLENIVSLMAKETRMIADSIYAKIPGTMQKFLEPENIKQEIRLHFTERGLASHIDDQNFNNVVMKLQKTIQKKFDEQEIKLNMTDVLSQRILEQCLHQLDFETAMIVKFDGQYIGEESTHWSDVNYYVYGEIEHEISENLFFVFSDWLVTSIREYVPEFILLFIEYLLELKHQYKFDLKIDLNGLTVPRENMEKLSDLIKQKGLDETISSLRRTHGVTWDDLDNWNVEKILFWVSLDDRVLFK